MLLLIIIKKKEHPNSVDEEAVVQHSFIEEIVSNIPVTIALFDVKDTNYSNIQRFGNYKV